MREESPFLRVDALRRSFGRLHAVNEVSFSVREGEVVGIVGPNGSGKTTLLNVISGIYSPSSGRVFLRATRIDRLERHRIARLGLARSFQNPRVFASLNGVEHCIAAWTASRAPNSRTIPLGLLRLPWQSMVADAMPHLTEIFGSEIPRGRADGLPYGRKRLLELARCLAANPKLLLLDEPTSGLNDEETAAFQGVLSGVLAKRALTALIVDHKFDFVRSVCSRVIVLEHGRIIADGAGDEIVKDKNVIEAYFGLEPG